MLSDWKIYLPKVLRQSAPKHVHSGGQQVSFFVRSIGKTLSFLYYLLIISLTKWRRAYGISVLAATPVWALVSFKTHISRDNIRSYKFQRANRRFTSKRTGFVTYFSGAGLRVVYLAIIYSTSVL